MRKAYSSSLGVDEFFHIRRLLNDYAGLWFGEEARPLVERRLRDRVIFSGATGFSDYIERLAAGSTAELDEAVEACTVNETYVFRQEGQLKAFQRRVLKKLASRERLTIWSAGCASGEEVYTIGALVLESGLFPPEKVRIFGTDISRRCIAIARRGVYSASSFRSEGGMLFERYFPRSGDGDKRTVADSLRAICHFRHANLIKESDSSTLGNVDVVFCRNVLIHFDDASRRRVVRCFYDRITPGGFLLLGHSESLLNQVTSFDAIELDEDIVYRKPSIDDLVNRNDKGGRR
jgi:chemotaxis protein methyltransferase CheR